MAAAQKQNVVEDEKQKGPAEQAVSAVVAGLKFVVKDMAMPAAERLIPQGRDELTNAIYNSSAYWPGQQPPHVTPEAAAPAVDAQQTVEERVSNVIYYAEAKEAVLTERAIDKEVAGMSPAEQKIAESFRATPEQQIEQQPEPSALDKLKAMFGREAAPENEKQAEAETQEMEMSA